MYDFVGDIHGEFEKLVELLEKLGYQKRNGVYQHESRKVFFLGDLIDRGPKIKEVLDLVMAMVNTNQAKCILGNHEYNLLNYFTKDRDGHDFLRIHSDKNTKQCKETLKQIPESEMPRYLDFFRSLPFYYEGEGFRAVHACWHDELIKVVKDHISEKTITSEVLYRIEEDQKLKEAIEVILKGPEVKLPHGLSFKDKDGHERSEVRVSWWDKENALTHKVEGLNEDEFLKRSQISFYESHHLPVFFGHYWMRGKPSPFLTQINAVCLDFSVAKGGHLASYRFNGEKVLDEGKMVWC